MIEEFFGEENVQQEGVEYTVRLDDFILKDDFDNEHLIKGMYLQFDYSEDEDKHYLNMLKGRRVIQSDIEYHMGFIHPHLPTGKIDKKGWSPFCMGSSNFSIHYNNCIYGVSEEEMYAFLMHLKYFLSYEDDSNPYIKLRDVLPLQKVSDLHYFLPGGIEILLESDKVKKFQFNTDLHLINNKHNHSLLLSVYPDVAPCVYVNGDIYKLVSNIETDHIPVNVFTFKGKEIYTSVYQQKVVVELNEDNKRFNPVLFKIIDDEIHHRIKHKISQEVFKTIGTAEEVQIDNYRQLPESVKVSLFSYS